MGYLRERTDSLVTIDSIKKEIALLLIKELNDYAIKHPERYPKELHSRVHEIGEVLDDLGGLELMRCACAVVPYNHNIHLDRLWNGIGSWLT